MQRAGHWGARRDAVRARGVRSADEGGATFAAGGNCQRCLYVTAQDRFASRADLPACDRNPSFVRVKYSARRLAVVLTVACAAACVAQQPANMLARTPPMGWNSWNHFGCNVSAELIRGVADAMATNGMRDAGYRYVVIDDCWQVARDKNGRIVADSARFPTGIKALADYVHSKA